jgi:prepilin-type N-terminal cleavage/methylation domain-containing protein
MARNSCRPRAFTLIELIVVLAVTAILMSMVYPMYTSISERAKATKDMSNLRQIGLATQTYMNDNDGFFPGSPTASWMTQLELNQKYLSVWRIIQSPFGKRSSSEAGDATTPISYGINSNLYPPPNNVAIAASKVTNPSGFILFAPEQALGGTVSFQGTAVSTAPGVTVLGTGGNTAMSTPGGSATGGTHNSRRRIDALFSDLHCETMTCTAFAITTSSVPGQPGQWTPSTPYP